MKSHRFPLTLLAGALTLAVAPADAAAERRGQAVRGGARSVVVARPVYRPSLAR